MLKKSLKFGSMLLLIFAMATFAFIGCSNGTTDDDPLDDPVVPVDPVDPVDPTDPTDPVDPNPPVTVTGITIDPVNVELLAGARQLFTAVVGGTATDKTVTWSVAVSDSYVWEYVPRDGTKIEDRKGLGYLTIDGGERPGIVLTVTAVSNADPSVYGEATVTVVNPGPRLSWTPNQIAVTAAGDDGSLSLTGSGDDVVSVGRLLDFYGKDIQIAELDEYILGRDYSIRRVDNLNNSLEGGDIEIEADPEAGTITVTLSGAIQGPNGTPIDKGLIGVTLFPSVLEGADVSLIDLSGPGAELIFNVTSDLLIETLGDVESFDSPLHGSPAPATYVNFDDAVADPRFSGAVIARTGLSSGSYTYRSPASLTVRLSRIGDYKFYPPAITEALVRSKFGGGLAPQVTGLSASQTAVTFTLTYTIPVKTIFTDTGTPVAADEAYVDAGFDGKLRGLIVDKLVQHGEKAPKALLVTGESPYYSLNRPVTWVAATMGPNDTFFGGRSATANITIPAKPGYTFTNTAITADDLKVYFDIVAGAGVISPIESAVDIISADDSLVFTVSYYVVKAPIIAATIDTGILVKDKLAAPGNNVSVPKTLKVAATAPFTFDSISIRGVAGTKYTFGDEPVITITLLAKDGYMFDEGVFDQGSQLGNPAANAFTKTNGVVVDSEVIFNQLTTLVVELTLSPYPETVSLPGNQLFNGNLQNLSGGDIEHEGLTSDAAPTAAASTEVEAMGGVNRSTFTWDLTNYSPYFHWTQSVPRATATVVLVPKTGFTFDGYPRTDGLATALSAYFSSGGYTALVTKASFNSATSENLSFKVSYLIDRKDVGETIDEGLVGDINAILSESNNIDSADLVWTLPNLAGKHLTGVAQITDVSASNVNDLNEDETVTVTIVLTAEEGYGFNLNAGNITTAESAVLSGVNAAQAKGTSNATITPNPAEDADELTIIIELVVKS